VPLFAFPMNEFVLGGVLHLHLPVRSGYTSHGCETTNFSDVFDCGA
jgi:hypothetical protein